MNQTPIPVLIADLVDELCDPRQHREPRWTWSSQRNRINLPPHITIQPGLLIQLHNAVIPAASTREDGGLHATAKSAPPLQLEALAAYVDISLAAAAWCDTFTITLRGTVQDNIRALAGARHGDHATELLADLRRWRGAAATLTGWQAVIKPDARCPVIDCEADGPGSLRINLTNSTAVCIVCRSWWDHATIGLLAEHITKTTTRVRVPVRSGAVGHGGWRTRETNGANT